MEEVARISSYELIFGQKPQLLSTLTKPWQEITHREFVTDLINRLFYLKKYAEENLRKVTESAKQYYDKRIKPLTLDPKDYYLSSA